ncbi:DsrE family protein [Longitalea arenae]|uniref:DsrE family protein n=1 Tax=Longitalea arenae TaxID=2812558 RepID=UPI0019686CFC|nr:DsrE family protein [Longitalea arenae]
MYKYSLLIVVFAFLPACILAQNAKNRAASNKNKAADLAAYKVIFDITSGDTAAHKTVIRQLKGISQARPDAQLEVAIYSDALGMVMKDQSTIADAILELSSNNRARFKVCAATMKRNNVDKSQLVAGVDVVPDAIYEIVARQHEGWGYIKVAQ